MAFIKRPSRASTDQTGNRFLFWLYATGLQRAPCRLGRVVSGLVVAGNPLLNCGMTKNVVPSRRFRTDPVVARVLPIGERGSRQSRTPFNASRWLRPPARAGFGASAEGCRLDNCRPGETPTTQY
jgi:hypothetical protein